MISADVEASGIIPAKHSILSIGAVDLHDPERQFYGECRAWDGAEYMEDAFEVNGFTIADMTDPNKQSLEELMGKFYEWMAEAKEKTLAAQNVSFDRDFLNDSFGRSHISWHFSYRTVDLHSVAYADHIKRGIPIPMKNDRTGLNLDKILNYVGIPDEPTPHNALTGAQSTAEALSRILYGKKLLKEFERFDVPEIFEAE